jgi:hypothetical protein
MNNLNLTKKYISSFFYALLFAIANVISWANVAVAQLRLGSGVQPGLESYILEYQLRGLPLNKVRGINSCSVGFGVSCNKTGAILQQIVEQYSGRTYDDLLVEAAGGINNYRQFLQFYSRLSDSVTSSMPFNSFWLNGNPLILDSYENSGIGKLSSNSVPNLHEIISRFNYAPVIWGRHSLNLRQGLIGLKTAYGFTLVKEALKIPNIEAKIATFGLNESETAFHIQQFHQAVISLNSNNAQTINLALFEILSNPYTDVAAEQNRPPLRIKEDPDWLQGVILEGEEEAISSWFGGEGSEIALQSSPDIVFDNSDLTPVYVIGGIGGFTLLVLLLIGDSDSGKSTSRQVVVVPIPNTPSPTPKPRDILKIPESNNIGGLIVLTILGLIFCKKKITSNERNCNRLFSD